MLVMIAHDVLHQFYPPIFKYLIEKACLFKKKNDFEIFVKT